MRGYSFLELIFVLGVAGTLAAAATPQLLVTVDDFRALGAVRYLSTRLHEARMEAVMRNANVAMRFTQASGVYEYTVYQDRNGNGVLSHDIQLGVDSAIHPVERLQDQFGRRRLRCAPGDSTADPSGTAPGGDPIHLGASDMVSFTAMARPARERFTSAAAGHAVRHCDLWRNRQDADSEIQHAQSRLENTMTDDFAERDRRRTRRLSATDQHGIVAPVSAPGTTSRSSTSPPGRAARERHRLLPGVSVDLHLATPDERVAVRGRVLRCFVARLRATGVWYHGAIGFDRHLPWYVDDDPAGYGIPGAELRPRRAGRAPRSPFVPG